MDITDQLNRFFKPVTARVRNMIVRGVIKLVNDELKVQKIQASLLAGELKDGLEHYQDYGITSMPRQDQRLSSYFVAGIAQTASL